jgi:predicted ATPase
VIAGLDPLYIKTRPTKVVPRLISYALFEGRPPATRGKWINPLVFANFALDMRLPQLRKVEKPIFIIGMGRSGSTILGMLMSMHRDVGYLNEPKALWHAVYPHEDIHANYSKGPARYSLDESAATEEVRRRAHRLLGAYLWAVASSRVVDKYPELVFRVPFVRAIFPDARFIFLVRNGRDTCRSINQYVEQKGIQKPDGGTQNWWGANTRKWELMLKQLVPKEEALADILRGRRVKPSHRYGCGGVDRHHAGRLALNGALSRLRAPATLRVARR